MDEKRLPYRLWTRYLSAFDGVRIVARALMDVIVSTEHRFQQTPDGCVWTQVAFSYRFWQRYLDVFDNVLVLARVLPVTSVPSDWERADGSSVSFVALPYYVGPAQCLRRLMPVRRAIKSAGSREAAVVMRVPSFLSAHLAPTLYRTGQPYGVEVVGDPWDAFSPAASRHVLAPLVRRWLSCHMRRQCANATAAAYVTERTLQRRYPCAAYTIGVSDVALPNDGIVENGGVLATTFSNVDLSNENAVIRSVPAQRCGPLRLITVASLQRRYKGVHHLISATAACLRQGLSLELTVVGDGGLRPALESQARRLGIQDRVRFVGQVSSGEAVRQHLDSANIFVLASLTEGLPRAMVEAMGRALPCIGSAIGGISEILPAEDLVPPGDVGALAAKIAEVAAHPDRRDRMAKANLARAQAFCEPVLRKRRLAFYRHLHEATVRWLGNNGRNLTSSKSETPAFTSP